MITSAPHIYENVPSLKIFTYFDVPEQVGDRVNDVYNQYKACALIQCFQGLTGVFVFSQGGDERVQDNDNIGVVWVFVKELGGGELMECNLTI